MKYITLVLFVFCSSFSYSQDVFDSSLEMIEKINGQLMDAASSFLEYPYEHENTVRVYGRIKTINALYKEQQSHKYELLSQYDNYKARQYFASINKMQPLAEVLEELLRTIAGYISRGIEGPKMEIVLEPLLDAMGWTKRSLDVICKDVYFCEYEYKGFKMMFAKNILPKNDYSRNAYHTIQVSLTYEGMLGSGASYNVGGNLYRMIQYKDNENHQYRKLIKAKSKRE